MAGKKKSTTKKRGTKKAEASRTHDFGHAVLSALTIAMISDGEIAAAERAVLRRFANELEAIDVDAVIDATIMRWADEGAEPILEEVATKLSTDEARETAFASCIAIAASDGKITPSETRMLRTLREALKIPTERAKILAGPIAAVFS